VEGCQGILDPLKVATEQYFPAPASVVEISVGGVLVRPRRLTRLTGCRFGPLPAAGGLPEPATGGHEHQSRGAAGEPSRQPWRWGRRRRCWWTEPPALNAAFLDGHPACQVGKGIRSADWAPVFTVKLLTIQAQPRAAKLHGSSLCLAKRKPRSGPLLRKNSVRASVRTQAAGYTTLTGWCHHGRPERTRSTWANQARQKLQLVPPFRTEGPIGLECRPSGGLLS
jgi:hypothetical protein